jgi:citronellol/citronellal dehydrogenase
MVAPDRNVRKVVVVTGASRGIGRAVAGAFARRGCSLVIAARSTDLSPNRAGLPGTLESVGTELRSHGVDVLAVPADLSRAEEAEALVASTIDRFGRCDVLVNNAAVSFLGRFVDVPARRWNPVLAVNLLAPVVLIHGFAPGMIERGDGRIINISSGAANTRPGATGGETVHQLPYAASKAGLEALTFGLADQLRGTGVAVNALRPTVATEAVALGAPHLLEDTSGRWARPEPYADAVVWLADQPDSFTGQLLSNDDLRARGVLTG